MSMYLPNPDLHPTGSESVEYIDAPPMTEVAPPSAGLDKQTRLNITRWAEEYIAGLVANHHGAPEDVRSIIHELHDQKANPDHDGSW
jgi:hypothetical protein